MVFKMELTYHEIAETLDTKKIRQNLIDTLFYQEFKKILTLN